MPPLRSFSVAIAITGSLGAASLPGAPLSAQDSVPRYVREHYVQREYRIPMRDGVRLFTIVFTPRDTTRRYPILLSRTPYGSDTYLNPVGPAEAFSRAGYIFVFQDVRGKYRSEGEFVQVRPFRARGASARGTDESTDTYDTIAWLLEHVPGNNGRVGQYGISYLGFYATLGLPSAHPALKAVSPQAPVSDWFVGDDFHHNGAFFLLDFFDFIPNFDFPRTGPTAKPEEPFRFTRPDDYRFFLEEVGPLGDVSVRLFQHRVPFWDSVMAHPTYDAFWKARTPLQHLRNIQPAVLTVGGWFDAEDLWGTLAVYHAIERQNPGAINRLAIGPWEHGGWFLSDGSGFADLRFPTKTADDYHTQVELPFFEAFLKGTGAAPAVEAFMYETGANRWRTFDRWPPKGVTNRTLFLLPGRRLEFADPGAAAASPAYDEFVSDPQRPVPYIDGTLSARSPNYMAADQRFAWRRPDVLTYETAPLAHDITVAGPTAVRLFVSTTGTDADWVVKLIDVYPNDTPEPNPNPTGVRMGGYQQLVRAEVMRGKFRTSLERPAPFIPGKVTRVEFTLPDVLHTFKAGHRLMVQIQSSWFPLVDRNPQTFVDIYRASDGDFRPAVHRVYRKGATRSALVLPVLAAD